MKRGFTSARVQIEHMEQKKPTDAMVSGLALHSATNCQQKATGLGPCLVLHTLIQFRCFWNFEVKKGFWPKTQWFEWKKPAFFTTRRVAVAPENLCFSDSKLLDAHGHKRCFRISLCRSHPRFRLQHPPERSHMFFFFFACTGQHGSSDRRRKLRLFHDGAGNPGGR